MTALKNILNLTTFKNLVFPCFLWLLSTVLADSTSEIRASILRSVFFLHTWHGRTHCSKKLLKELSGRGSICGGKWIASLKKGPTQRMDHVSNPEFSNLALAISISYLKLITGLPWRVQCFRPLSTQWTHRFLLGFYLILIWTVCSHLYPGCPPILHHFKNLPYFYTLPPFFPCMSSPFHFPSGRPEDLLSWILFSWYKESTSSHQLTFTSTWHHVSLPSATFLFDPSYFHLTKFIWTISDIFFLNLLGSICGDRLSTDSL